MKLLRSTALKSEPAGIPASLSDLFALASAMEGEAAHQYQQLADEMSAQDRTDLSAVFIHLAAAEREHVDRVAQWAQSRIGAPPDPSLVRWEAPGIFDGAAAAELATSRLMTPYRALSLAVRNEESAFAFWAYVAAYAYAPEVKSAAESMAREELDHVAMLRRERRRAYHETRGSAHEASATDAPRHVDAAALECRLAAELADIARWRDGASADRARELHRETQQMAEEAAGIGRLAASLADRDAMTMAEALADVYLEAADAGESAARVAILQSLASRAIGRLAWLRALRAPPEGIKS